MIKFFLYLVIVFSSALYANINSNGENNEFERFDGETLIFQVDGDIKITCNKRGSCTLLSTEIVDRPFTVSFNIGKNNNSYSSLDSSIRKFTGFSGRYGGDNKFWWRGRIIYHVGVGKCFQDIKVPRALHYSVSRNFYTFINNDKLNPKSFIPVDEAMTIFYTTILKQTADCKSN